MSIGSGSSKLIFEEEKEKALKVEEDSWKLYPNPTDNQLIFEYSWVDEKTSAKVEIYDMIGKNWKQLSLENQHGNETIDISNLSEGLYIFIIRDGKEIKGRSKIIILR